MPAVLDGTNGLTFNDNTRMGSAQFSNRLINPNFLINQRAATGTVVLAAGAYGLDRWKAGASGCTFTFAVSANVTTLTISAGTLMQVIEGTNLQSGVHVLSWTGSALGRIDAGSYSASGVTGTASGGTNQTIEFAAGTLVMPRYNQGAASSVQFLPVGLELALCQRYYWRNNYANGAYIANLQAFQPTNVFGVIAYPPVPMRTVPTSVGRSALNTFMLFAATGTPDSVVTTFSIAMLDANGPIFSGNILKTGASLVAGDASVLSATGGATFIEATAEL